jgi:hypothetical protein
VARLNLHELFIGGLEDLSLAGEELFGKVELVFIND